MTGDSTPQNDTHSNLLDCRSVCRRLLDTETRPRAHRESHLLFDEIEDMQSVSISSQSYDSLDSRNEIFENSPSEFHEKIESYRLARKELTARRLALEGRLYKLKWASSIR